MNESCVRSIAISAAFAIAVLAGCAWAPRAHPELDAAMKEFPTDPNASTIYVYRSGYNWSGEQSTLYMDGHLIGNTRPGTYFRIDTTAERHVLHGAALDAGQIAVNPRPGQVVFVKVDVVGRQSNFKFQSDAVGRQQVRACCVMIESWPGTGLAHVR